MVSGAGGVPAGVDAALRRLAAAARRDGYADVAANVIGGRPVGVSLSADGSEARRFAMIGGAWHEGFDVGDVGGD